MEMVFAENCNLLEHIFLEDRESVQFCLKTRADDREGNKDH